jgi:hypothetical protein
MSFTFTGRPTLPASVPDGTSNTVAFAEHYSQCWETQYSFVQSISMGLQYRRATFADRSLIAQGTFGQLYHDDVTPITVGSPPITRASTPGRTFQARPKFEDCDPRVPQTPHAAGMLVGLFDGSVRTVRSGIDETVFWAAVTPAGGEVAPLD